MKWLLLLSVFFCVNDELIIFQKESKRQNWYITNDDVMGGISTSKMIFNTEGKAIFQGEVSTENNGGFAMVRLPIKLDLDSKKSKVVLKVKGDGKKYQFRLKSKKRERFWYVQSFQTTKDEQEIILPLSSFYPSFRGYRLNLGNFSSQTIGEIAILIANKKDEKFKLEIEKISIR